MESSNGKKQQNMQTKLTNRHFVLNGHQICKMCMTYMAILLLCNAWPTHYGHVRVSVVYRSIDRSTAMTATVAAVAAVTATLYKNYHYSYYGLLFTTAQHCFVH